MLMMTTGVETMPTKASTQANEPIRMFVVFVNVLSLSVTIRTKTLPNKVTMPTHNWIGTRILTVIALSTVVLAPM